MKKTIDILLSLTMILSLAACGNSNSAKQTNNSSVVETSPVEISVTTQEQSSDIQDTETSEAAQEQSSTTQENEHVDTIEAQSSESETPQEQETKILVAYFSATNTTEGVAQHIADGLNADLYEIIPVQPYTDADTVYCT